MAYIQRNIPSPNKLYSFTLDNFVGGLNNRDQLPEENQCTDVMNMAFTADGVMEKRHGTKEFDSLKLDGPITWIDEFKPHKESNVLIRATETKVYIGNTLLRTNAKQMHGLNHDGKYFFCDGSGLYVYGRFDQEESTYVKIIGTKTENYVLMEVVSPPTSYTPLDNTHTEGVRKVDYTNRKVWYEPCKNEVEDTFKEGNVVPTKPRFITSREGRLFIAGSDDDDDTVFISDTGNPYYFPAVLTMQLPPNSDRISGVAVYNDAVIVGRRMDIHAITGDTNRTDAGLPVFRLRRLNSHFGFASQRAVVNAHNYLFFLGTDSQFYAMRHTDTSTDVLNTQVISKDLDIHGSPVSVKKDDIWAASGVFFEDCYYVSVGDKVLVYNYLHQAWTVYNQIEARSFYVLFDILLMGDKHGKIVMESEDYLDSGKPFEAYWQTKFLTMNDPHTQKMFRDFFIVSRSREKIASNIHLKFEIDYADVKTDVSVQTNFSIWGKSQWGDMFISREINTSLPFSIYRRGRQVRIRFSNGYPLKGEVKTLTDLHSYITTQKYIVMKVTDENKYYILDDSGWRIWEKHEYDQPMCVLQINGEYEFKWKR